MNYLYQGPILFLAVTGVTTESTRGGELAELVANHVFGNVDRDKLVAVVDSECVSYELGGNHGGAAPGLDYRLLAGLLHSSHLLLKLNADKRAFFQ